MARIESSRSQSLTHTEPTNEQNTWLELGPQQTNIYFCLVSGTPRDPQKSSKQKRELILGKNRSPSSKSERCAQQEKRLQAASRSMQTDWLPFNWLPFHKLQSQPLFKHTDVAESMQRACFRKQVQAPNRNQRGSEQENKGNLRKIMRGACKPVLGPLCGYVKRGGPKQSFPVGFRFDQNKNRVPSDISQQMLASVLTKTKTGYPQTYHNNKYLEA